MPLLAAQLVLSASLIVQSFNQSIHCHFRAASSLTKNCSHCVSPGWRITVWLSVSLFSRFNWMNISTRYSRGSHFDPEATHWEVWWWMGRKVSHTKGFFWITFLGILFVNLGCHLGERQQLFAPSDCSLDVERFEWGCWKWSDRRWHYAHH